VAVLSALKIVLPALTKHLVSIAEMDITLILLPCAKHVLLTVHSALTEHVFTVNQVTYLILKIIVQLAHKIVALAQKRMFVKIAM